MNTTRWLCALLFPVMAFAQTASTPPTPAGQAPAPAVTYESGVAKLLDQLQLNDSQMPAWQNYAAKINAYSRMIYEEKPIAAYATETGARQIGRMVDSLQNRLAALEDIEDAAKALYAVLGAEQKKIADQRMVSAIPVWVSGELANCPGASDKKDKSSRPDTGQRHRGGMGNGGGMGGMGGMSGM